MRSAGMNEFTIETIHARVIVVGSGAAGFAAANALYDRGVRDAVIVTEHINCGTSRNTGSDKQTYYKLSLCGDDADSVRKMAETLYDGGCMDGDLALAEAAGSAECFFDLVRLGVPFPRNRYGEYAGYKTDHDPAQRASSAGPLTSKMMTEALQRETEQKNIPVYSGWLVVRILQCNNRVQGILCLGTEEGPEKDPVFRIFRAPAIIWATGGPAGIYYDSVYPHGHHGASGIAFLAGAKGRSLTEWQYGLASVRPRWNVSGTYMQVLPRMISTEEDGSDEREFLLSYFSSEEEALDRLFLKGYQWPFDIRKCNGGSSDIDLAVYQETVRKKRRVFLDFRSNPWNRTCESWHLSQEAERYLKAADAWFGTPVERLKHMNEPAVDFYRSRGIDLEKEPLEIALCAQHNNGGIAVDLWWRTSVEGLFAVGEAAGTHGIYRPGGAALNSGQVGARRAAAYIAAHQNEYTRMPLAEQCTQQAEEVVKMTAEIRNSSGENTAEYWIAFFQKKMSASAGPFRFCDEIFSLRDETEAFLCDFKTKVRVGTTGIKGVFLLEEVLLSQKMYLSAMADYIEKGAGNRGSAIYLPEQEANPEMKERIQEVRMDGSGQVVSAWRQPHPLPESSGAFEEVWRRYRKDQNIY